MNQSDLLALFDQQQRIEVTFNDSVREEVDGVVRHVPRFGKTGFVLYARMDAENADAVIADQIRYFTRLGYEFEWKTYSHDQPADLGDRLMAHGFVLDDRESVMVLDLMEDDALLQHHTELDIRRLTDPAHVHHVALVEEAVWGHSFDALTERLEHDLREAPDDMSVYVAYADGAPVSAAWMYYHPGADFASFWGGSTLAAYRRRGFYTGLLAVRAQEAAARGVRFLTVDASDMSRPVLAKHGFVHLVDTYGYRYQTNADEEPKE
ncbi:MAG: hypothetical protein R2851_26790 [Caldilineaceae bacterium]